MDLYTLEAEARLITDGENESAQTHTVPTPTRRAITLVK